MKYDQKYVSIMAFVSLSLCAVICSVIISSCGEDPPTGHSHEGTGTIVINQTPDVLAGAGWALTGPQNGAGFGDSTLTDLPTGTYTLTWDAVSGYTTPASDTGTLAADSTITFSGTYTAGDFVLIQAGTFTMGSPTDEPERSYNEAQHEVTLSKGFYMSKFEVSEEWWYQVMGGTPTASQLPKDNITWDMAVTFCNALSILVGLDPAYTINGLYGDVTWNRSANGYRLPTEAEWEYACRAGAVLAFNNNTNCLSSDTEANYNGSFPLTGCPTGVYRATRTEIGIFPPNQWGLYDMHGNLWEWVWDCYRDDYENLDSVDPVYDAGPGAERVIRSGVWISRAVHCRSAKRGSSDPGSSSASGLRPVRSAE